MNDVAGALARMAPFEGLDEEQIGWLAERGDVVEVPAGTRLFEPGPEEYEALWTLMKGEIVVSRVVGDREVEGARSDKPGAWAGAMPGAGETSYGVTARVSRDSTMFRIPRQTVEAMMRSGFPIARHFLSGLTRGTRNMEAMVRQHEKLESLGKLAAGIAHEINNPAAAAARASAELRRLLDHLVAPHGGSEAELERAVTSLEPSLSLTPLQRNEREEALADWLTNRALGDAWDLAPQLVEAGVTPRWLDDLAARVPADALPDALRALAARRLLDEVEGCLGRISELVGALKSYSYVDRAPVQDVDLRKSIGDTLTVLKHKLAGISVELQIESDVPNIEAYGSELSEVWTNLLDNAADALDGAGHITIGARREGGYVVVEVADDGPGIPEDIQSRIFDAFFTTKDVGRGMGLGLEIVHRIVVSRHKGELKVTSRPGETRFTVRLPLALSAKP